MDENGKPIVNITIRRNVTNVHMEDMAWSDELEAACDCTIRWTEVADNAWGQQKAAKMVAGEFPDISMSLFDPADASRYPSQFEDLAEHLDEMPNVKEFLDERPIARKMVEDDGHIYLLPSDRGKGYRVSATHMFINKTWLDKLGLDVPTTWDELEDVLKAFKTEDPNGNGETDEIPMNIRSLGFGLWSPLVLLNSTGLTTSFMGASASTQGMYVDDGEVKSILTSDNLKQVISYLHKLVEEGLIPKDALTRDGSQYDAQTISDGETAVTGVSIGWSAQGEYGNLSDQYISLPALKAESSMDEEDVTWDYSQDFTEFAYALSVSPKAANKEAVYKVIDAMYSERISVEQYYGSIGEYVTDQGDGTYEVSDKVYEKYVDTREVAAQDRFAGYIADDVTINNDTNADAVSASDAAYADALANVDPVKDVVPIYVRPDSDDMDTLSENNTSIFNYANNQLATWLVSGGIEDEWDDYLAKINERTLGLDQNIGIWQKWYNAYLEEQ
ncbi:extracellular solute-binding protein [Bifidobacterium lemurum]|uniref:extracellular solute-binding protein n=1 Tax=Bifidobacterium lemurum TaxID=1603886 RepID=UPI001D016DF3|nr:extracellular solute-binding protein [Bifidobacterium lemurum]